MLQEKINKMSDAELYTVVEDHQGDEVLSAAALRLVRENRKLKAALKVYQDRDKQLEDILGVDGEVGNE
jgi:t-SNARE complex subunit (syntaxin)